MYSKSYRVLAALLLVFLVASGCSAEVAENAEAAENIEVANTVTGCNTEQGECENPEAKISDAPPEDPNCPSRAYVIRCAGIHLDKNQNGKLERAELQSAIDKLRWYSRGQSLVLLLDRLNIRCSVC